MAKKGFAYFDQYGILHVTESESTARRYGKFVEVELNYDGGYPKTTEGENIIVYDRGAHIRIGNKNNENGRDIKPEQVPHIVAIIEQLNK